ncbi:MAG: MBL fold metallo-hydrolase, partial [Xanthomonadales bacterium]|nr:MBL fold metallo-hydrolase [Xanthomonadales bacterium]
MNISLFRSLALVAFAIAILILSGPVHGESGQLASFKNAYRLVHESLSKHGDHRAVETAGGFQVRLHGTYDLTTRLQGRSAFRDEPTDIEEHITYDARKGWVSYDADYFNYFSSNQKYREIYDDQGRVIYIDKLNSDGGWLPFEMVPDARERYLRVLPGMLLAEALRHSRSLRSVGESQAGGAVLDVVSFTTPGGDALYLSIDRETRLLSSASALIDMPLLGWTRMSWNWAGYAPGKSGLVNPARLEVRLGDRILKSVDMTTTFGGYPDAFEAPEGVDIGDPPEDLLRRADFVPYGERPPEVETLVPQVYLVKGLRPGFGMVFVEFDEYVVAVDAPTGWYEMNQIPPMNWSHGDAIDALGRKYLRAIAQTVPDKPVRYVVLSHHHSDHIGGILPFIDAGA